MFFFMSHKWNILAKYIFSYHWKSYNYLNGITESIILDMG